MRTCESYMFAWTYNVCSRERIKVNMPIQIRILAKFLNFLRSTKVEPISVGSPRDKTISKHKLPPTDRQTKKDCEQMARRLPSELRFSTTTNVGKMDPSGGILLQYHVPHVHQNGIIKSSVWVWTPLLHWHSFGWQSHTKGEGLASGGTRHAELLERKPTVDTKSREDVHRETQNREEFRSGRSSLSLASAILIILIKGNRKEKIEAMILWPL